MDDIMTDTAFWSGITIGALIWCGIGLHRLIPEIHARRRETDYELGLAQLEEWADRMAVRIDSTHPLESVARLHCAIASHGSYVVPVYELQDAQCPRCEAAGQASLTAAVDIARARLVGGGSR